MGKSKSPFEFRLAPIKCECTTVCRWCWHPVPECICDDGVESEKAVDEKQSEAEPK